MIVVLIDDCGFVKDVNVVVFDVFLIFFRMVNFYFLWFFDEEFIWVFLNVLEGDDFD